MNRTVKTMGAAVVLAGVMGAAGCWDIEGDRRRAEADAKRAMTSAELAAKAREREGVEPLFDGKTLKGWTQRGGKASYRVEQVGGQGVIVGTTVPNTPNSFLCTEKTYGDFELTLEFKVDSRVNSGVQFRSESTPEYQNGRVHGYQVEIDPSERAWTGGIYDEGRRGWLADLKPNAEPWSGAKFDEVRKTWVADPAASAAARGAFKQNEWNTMRLVAEGDTLSTWINGVPVIRGFKDDRTASGFIALQVHDVGKNEEPMEVRWRKIYIREIVKGR